MLASIPSTDPRQAKQTKIRCRGGTFAACAYANPAPMLMQVIYPGPAIPIALWVTDCINRISVAPEAFGVIRREKLG